MRQRIDVRSVTGLQDLLEESVDSHVQVPSNKRDQDWTRIGVMCVNSGNGLLRTQMKLEELEERRAREDAKANRQSEAVA